MRKSDAKPPLRFVADPGSSYLPRCHCATQPPMYPIYEDNGRRNRVLVQCPKCGALARVTLRIRWLKSLRLLEGTRR